MKTNFNLLAQAKQKHQHGNLAAALPLYERVLAIQPKDRQTLYYAAAAFCQAGQFKKALALCDRLIALAPDMPEALLVRGNSYSGLKAYQNALADLNKVVMLQPGNYQAQANLGLTLANLNRLDDAIKAVGKALKLKPDYALGHKNMGYVYFETGQINNAIKSLRKSLALNPKDASTHYNLARAVAATAQFDAALKSYDTALALRPGYVDAMWNKALLVLRNGDFKTGWPLYEQRWNNPSFTDRKPDIAAPYWTGQFDIKGKTILLFSEQGLGDCIQFARLAKNVSQLGARVILAVPKRLVSFLSRIEGVSQTIERGGTMPDVDCVCALMSLPLALKLTLQEEGLSSPYLSADPVRVEQFGKKLGPAHGQRIGIVWSGSATHINDHNRSIPLDAIVSHLPKTAEIYCLQRDVNSSDQKVLEASPFIQMLSDYQVSFDDFEDTVAFCSLMDKIVSVDTSIAHLGAGLGVPTTVMLHSVPDFRWLTTGETSPWYETAKLVRRAVDAADWDQTLCQAFTS